MLHKKSLGQHFLRNQNVLKKIADAAELTAYDTILEVGPGEGTLTEFLLARAGKVVAVEKDARLIPVLEKKFSAEIASGKLELVCGDILGFDNTRCLPPTTSGVGGNGYKIVANIPYYITGQFLRKFLQNDAQPSSMALLLQKEVAKRIMGTRYPASLKLRRTMKESILSLSVKCYGTPKYLGTVKAGAFSPAPKVDSSILKVEDISKKFFEGISEEKFFSLLKRGFAHPRKLLASNLGIDPKVLKRCGIAEKARAEDVSLEQWRCLMTTRAPDLSALVMEVSCKQDQHKKDTERPAECNFPTEAR